MLSEPTVSALFLYPVKSCGGIELQTGFAGPRGLVSGEISDRSWMIVNPDGVLVSQRDFPSLASITCRLSPTSPHIVTLSIQGMAPLTLDQTKVGDIRQKVVIHGKETVGHQAAELVNAWFCEFLKTQVAVVYQKPIDERPCDARFAVNPGKDLVGFGDGFPYLFTGEGTLQGLNARLASQMPMDRFRPNIVIARTESEEEYGWKDIAIGSAAFTFVKPCTRCVMTTIDQEAGVKTGKEPLATLASTSFLVHEFERARVQGAIFGENAIASSYGILSVGDAILIRTTKPRYEFKTKKAT